MMMNLEIIERAEIPAEWLDTFKQYASVADNGRDALLMSMLTLAVLRVQEMADRMANTIVVIFFIDDKF